MGLSCSFFFSSKSLSARRAWIEIIFGGEFDTSEGVALRKESVDRNKLVQSTAVDLLWSLSARRAWIEIASRGRISGCTLVALRKESVDRNAEILQVCPMMSVSLSARRAWIEIKNCAFVPYTAYCRSPQGERG